MDCWGRGKTRILVDCFSAYLTTPQVCGYDLIPRNPVGVHINKLLDCCLSSGGFLSSNENTGRALQVVNGCSLCKELGVRQDLEIQTLIIASKHPAHRVSSSDRDSTLLHNNLVRCRHFRNFAGAELEVTELVDQS